MPSYSGVWTLVAQMQAEAAGNWPKPPVGLFAWGNNAQGRLGLGDEVNRSSPVQVGGLDKWSQVSISSSGFAVKTDGTLWAWGSNNAGQLGQNNTTNLSSPVQIGSLTGWSQVVHQIA